MSSGEQIAYRQLLARFELAFYRTLAPELAAACVEKQALLAAGLNPSSIRQLFDFDYWDLELGVYVLARADFVFAQRFPGLRYVQKRFEQYIELFEPAQRQTVSARYPMLHKRYWILTPESTLATNYVDQRSSD